MRTILKNRYALKNPTFSSNLTSFFPQNTIWVRTRIVWTVKKYIVSSNPHCANRTNSRGSHWDLCFGERSGLNARKSKPKPNDSRTACFWIFLFKCEACAFLSWKIQFKSKPSRIYKKVSSNKHCVPQKNLRGVPQGGLPLKGYRPYAVSLSLNPLSPQNYKIFPKHCIPDFPAFKFEQTLCLAEKLARREL